MKDINFVALCGRLGSDANHRPQEDGAVTITFDVATNTSQDNKPVWHKVMYRSSGEKESAFLAESLLSGVKVHVTGQIRSYTVADRKHLYIHATQCEVLSFPKERSRAAAAYEDEDARLAAAFGEEFAAPARPSVSPARVARQAPAVAAAPVAAPAMPAPRMHQPVVNTQSGLVPVRAGEVDFG